MVSRELGRPEVRAVTRARWAPNAMQARPVCDRPRRFSEANPLPGEPDKGPLSWRVPRQDSFCRRAGRSTRPQLRHPPSLRRLRRTWLGRPS